MKNRFQTLHSDTYKAILALIHVFALGLSQQAVAAGALARVTAEEVLAALRGATVRHVARTLVNVWKKQDIVILA